MTAPEFVALLEARGFAPRQVGDGRWLARCPAHDDRDPSLSVSVGRDHPVVVCCHADCEYGQVLAALGLGEADVCRDDDTQRPSRPATPKPAALPTDEQLAGWVAALQDKPAVLDRLRDLKGWSADTLARLGVGFDGKRVVFPIRDVTGQLVNTVRYTPNPGPGERKCMALRGRPRHLFGIDRVNGSNDVWLVEGEADVVSGYEAGLPAVVGLPGAESAKRFGEWAHLFTGRRVIVCFDCDEPGRAAARACAEALAAAGVEVLEPLDLDPDRHDGHDLGDFLLEAGAEAGPLLLESSSAGLAAYQARHGDQTEQATQTPPESASPESAPTITDEAAAFHGLAGRVVQAILPYTEAHPMALLVQFLAAFGNAIGRGAGFKADGAFHATNLYVVIVGKSSRGRKGTSWARILDLFKIADPDWARQCVTGGLSSGEGLIYCVRDAVYQTKQVKEKQRPTGETFEELVDAGVEDKRLFVQEGEFAAVLKVMSRQGSNLSGYVRNLWDHGTTRSLTKNDPNRTTDALVSIVGHISREELKREMTSTDATNGFANRFLFVHASRSKELPDPQEMPATEVEALADALQAALEYGAKPWTVKRTAAAGRLWRPAYSRLTSDVPGLVGAVTSRGEAQVMRLAALYALLDQSSEVDVEHLRAALAVWTYCEQTARWVFGDATGDPLSDRFLTALRNARSDGMTREELREAARSNAVPAEAIEQALGNLRELGLADCRKVRTGGKGRPAECWWAREHLPWEEKEEKEENRPQAAFSSYSSYSSYGSGGAE